MTNSSKTVGISQRDAIAAAALGIGCLALYIGLGAKALNLDGLGYAGRVESGDPKQMLLPGHLLYAPIMYAIYRFVAVFSSSGVDAARLMQVCDSIFAAAGVGVFVAALRRLRVSTFTAVVSGLALGITYTYWTHGTDLTTYAFSTFCLICAFYLLCEARSNSKSVNLWPIGGMVALATLIHQSNLVFLPAAMLGLYGIAANRFRSPITLAAISLLLICAPYGILGSIATGSRSPAVIAKWAAQGAHGYAPTFEPVNLARGVYGLANAVVYLDDAGTAIKGQAAHIAGAKLSSCGLLRLASKAGFAVFLVGAPSAAYVRRRKLSDEQKWLMRVAVAWIVPYALVALLFFTTDHDRWIMLLPAVAALAAVAYPNPTARGKVAAVGALAILFTVNVASAVYPAHTGTSNRYYQEAIHLAPRLSDHEVVIFWGHDHIGTAGYLRQLRKVEAVHVIDMVLKRGKPEALLELARMVEDASASRRRVLVLGLYGDNDGASDYLSEAHSLGLTRADVVGALSPFAAHPVFAMGRETVFELSAHPREAAP